MVERDVVLAKVATIDRALHRIADVRGERGAALRPIDVQDITALNLTRAAQAAIDLASQVVATEGFGLPPDLAGAFALLEQHGVISAERAARMRKMVGFRNVAVHQYDGLDPAIMEAICTRHLDDLRGFAADVIDAFGIDG